MPHIKIILHLVWSTKNRQPYLKNTIRPKILDHIRSNAREKGICIDYINCYHDHVHCLVSLGLDQNISKVVQLIKGESSHWINNEKLVPEKFGWQEEYFAVSVSESAIEKVRGYIKNQDQHHKWKTFQEEYDEFMKAYGFGKLG